MTAIRIAILCVSAAVICSTLRTQRPEMATAVSLSAGILALLMTSNAFAGASESIRHFAVLAQFDSSTSSTILKATGITIISELGAQICCDAGESALAGRIRLATRMVIIGMALPLIIQMGDLAAQFFV